ncbi:MAG: DUF2238 domain-containing protein [Polyangiaceae bacterium]
MARTDRFPFALLVGLAAVCVATAWRPPAGRLNWALEVVPGLLEVAVLAATYRRFPMSRLVYGTLFVHMLVLVYGGYYTYAATPLGEWTKVTFHLARNHYDRVGHLALGFFPTVLIRELLLRTSPLRPGRWLTGIALAIAFAIGAFWELIEWWTTLVVAGDVGSAFLGSQGDVWDAQWDMFLVGVGSALSLAVMTRWHDRSLAALASRGYGATELRRS